MLKDAPLKPAVVAGIMEALRQTIGATKKGERPAKRAERKPKHRSSGQGSVRQRCRR